MHLLDLKYVCFCQEPGPQSQVEVEKSIELGARTSESQDSGQSTIPTATGNLNAGNSEAVTASFDSSDLSDSELPERPLPETTTCDQNADGLFGLESEQLSFNVFGEFLYACIYF